MQEQQQVSVEDLETQDLVSKAYDLALERDVLKTQIQQASERVGLLNNSLAVVRQEIGKRRKAEAMEKAEEEPEPAPKKMGKKPKKLASVK